MSYQKTTTIKAIIFDLDGTLLNTLDDLADSMNRVLLRLGFPAHPVDAYRYFVGEGMEILARRALPAEGRDEETVQRCVAEMKSDYGAHWQDKTCPYPGIDDMLRALSARGISLNILSNKPDALTQVTVAAFFSAHTFDQVAGAREEYPRKPHPAGALHIAGSLRLACDQFLYLGDTNTDMQTANNSGMFALGALWGFRTEAELRESGARALLAHPLEILRHL
jgi:phosphoglycolate phosphatase